MNLQAFKLLLKRYPQLTSCALKIFRKTGFDIINGPNPQISILSQHDVNLVLDVGANIGRYGQELRVLGYRGKIVSFEPLSAVFKELSSAAKVDPLWRTSNIGLGNFDGQSLINIAKSTEFSSLMEPSSFLNEQYADSICVGKETIRIHKLDTIFSTYCEPSDKIFLKIDVQGYEREVLAGSSVSLKNIMGVQLELSFISHYKNELSFMEMLELMTTLGFTLVSLKPLAHDLKTGKLRQADGIFFRLN